MTKSLLDLGRSFSFPTTFVISAADVFSALEVFAAAVAVFEDKTIGVLICGDVEFGEDTTDEILLESSDWVTAEGGMLLATHTLYNICGNILEYL
jgi:hypothetical protein